MASAGLSIKAVVAELMAMTLFVYIGCGAASTFGSVQTPQGFELSGVNELGNYDSTVAMEAYIARNLKTLPSWGIVTALAFGLGITVMAYATGHLSGGQLNPAVTLGLVLTGALHPIQGIANVCAQVVGAILGASFLRGTLPDGGDSTLGSNSLAPGVSVGNAFLGEAVMTFVLVSVVLETAVNKKSATIRAQAPMAIGFAVFTAHAVLLPIDGCSINPARSLGPAIVSGTWPGSFWVFVVGPFVGALFTVPFHIFFRSDFDTLKSEDPLALDPALSDPNMANMTSGAKTADPLASPEKLSPVGSPAKGAADV